MRRRPFTLIEMLVVISIIVVMMGILLAAVKSVRNKAKVVQATSMMKQLEGAIAAYRSTYQDVLPFTLGCGTTAPIVIDSQPYLSSGAFTQVFAASAGTNKIVSADTTHYTDTYNVLLNTLQGNDAALNPRKQKFLELDSNGNYKDPWGNNFIVALDLDYNESIATSLLAGADTPLLRSVAIWSMGKDGKDTTGSGSTSALNKDNVNSWSSR